MSLSFAVVYLLWYISAPVSNEIYTFFSGNIMMLLDRIFTRAVVASGRTILIYVAGAAYGHPMVFKYEYFTFNIVLLLALILAVPRVEPKLRLKILILGVIIIFPIQILKFVVAVFCQYSTYMVDSNYKPYYSNVWKFIFQQGDSILTRVYGQLIPIMIWAGLFYYYKWHKLLEKRSGHKMPLSTEHSSSTA